MLARGVMCVPRGWGVLVCGACQHARSTAPTVLAREMRRPALRPPRSAIVRLRSGAVASRSGAFRLAAFRAAPCGHFASLVRSIASQSARLPSESFAFFGASRGRWAARLARARGGFRRASTPRGCLRTLRVRLRRIFPPLRFGAFPRIRLHPRGAIHPPLRRAWLGRDASLRQSHPSRRRLAPRGVGFALAPWQARLAPCALSAHVRFCGARSAHLTVSKVSALRLDCTESSLFAPRIL